MALSVSKYPPLLEFPSAVTLSSVMSPVERTSRLSEPEPPLLLNVPFVTLTVPEPDVLSKYAPYKLLLFEETSLSAILPSVETDTPLAEEPSTKILLIVTFPTQLVMVKFAPLLKVVSPDNP